MKLYQSLSAGNFVGQRVNAVRSGEWVFCRGNAIKCVFTETIANKIHLIKEIAGIIPVFRNQVYPMFCFTFIRGPFHQFVQGKIFQRDRPAILKIEIKMIS